MKFNEWSKERIRKGTKRLTSRREMHLADSDIDWVTPFPLPLWFICEFLYRDEGADSPEDLKKQIDKIFRKKVDINREFYVHVIKKNVIER